MVVVVDDVDDVDDVDEVDDVDAGAVLWSGGVLSTVVLSTSTGG